MSLIWLEKDLQIHPCWQVRSYGGPSFLKEEQQHRVGRRSKSNGELFEIQRQQKTYPSQRCVCFQGNDHVGLMEVVDLRGEENKTQWKMKSLKHFPREDTVVRNKWRGKKLSKGQRLVVSTPWIQQSEEWNILNDFKAPENVLSNVIHH